MERVHLPETWAECYTGARNQGDKRVVLTSTRNSDGN
jgi:hypothetical protein